MKQLFLDEASSAQRLSVTALLDAPLAGPTVLPDDVRGFSGVHGGLALALLTARMSDAAGAPPLRSVSAVFARPVPNEPAFEAALVRRGWTASVATGVISEAAGEAVRAQAVFSTAGPPTGQRFGGGALHLGSNMPAAPPPDRCELVEIPTAFVPFAQHTEIRAVGDARPFGAGPAPELTAWIRFVGDDIPPTELRLVTLVDSLAPSVFAVLTDLAVAPSVELSVHLHGLPSAQDGPWVLIRARVVDGRADGWHTEDIEVWSPDGRHLASARQLRLLRS